MARKICILSGKGGVGKSTVTANLGYALAKKNKRVLLIDFDFSLNSLDLLLSCHDSIVFDIADVLNKKCRFKQALVVDNVLPNLYCLLSGEFKPSKADFYALSSLLKKEQNLFDYILFDCGAGLNENLDTILKIVDEIIMVITPHYICIKDAQKIVEYSKKFSPLRISLIINRVRGDLIKSGKQMSPQEAFIRLGLSPLGIVPESDLLNGFCRKDNIWFDIMADNLLNGKHKIFDYTKSSQKVLRKLRV